LIFLPFLTEQCLSVEFRLNDFSNLIFKFTLSSPHDFSFDHLKRCHISKNCKACTNGYFLVGNTTRTRQSKTSCCLPCFSYKMTSSTYIFAATVVVCLCLGTLTRANYIDCSMECLFAAYRPPTFCECTNKVKLHWGKRTPSTRSRYLPTFRYGKRSVNLAGPELENDK